MSEDRVPFFQVDRQLRLAEVQHYRHLQRAVSEEEAMNVVTKEIDRRIAMLKSRLEGRANPELDVRAPMLW